MKEVSIIICGFGNIGRSFAEVYEQKRAVLREKYGLDLSCKAVIEINGSAVSKDGLPLMQLADHVKQGNPLESHPEFGKTDYDAFDAINEFEPGVLLECTPTNIETGEPGLSHIREAIKNARKDAQEANSWLQMYQARAKKKGHYWNQAKKGGASYMFSQERQVATSVG